MQRKPSTWLVICGLTCLAALLFMVSLMPAASSWQAQSDNYFPQAFQGFPSPTPTISPARLLITEISYDPLAKEPDAEWIEVANVGGIELSLADYKLGDEESLGGEEGMYQFPVGFGLAPGEAAVVAVRGATFASLYGYLPDFEMVESHPLVPTMLKHTAWALGGLSLDNGGDEVLLLGWRDTKMDAVSWGSSEYAFSPAAPDVLEAHSLERYPANLDHDAAFDWREQPAPAPGAIFTAEPTATPSPTPFGAPTATPSATPTMQLPQGWVLNEVHADPDNILGDANGDGSASVSADEFVEIVNLTGSVVDLSDWRLADGLQSRHIFPPGSLLPSGCALLVFGGGEPVGGFGGSLVQTASSGMLGLNDLGDIVRLLDQHGSLVLEFYFGSEAAQNQSITRSPDLVGDAPLLPHSLTDGAQGRLFSPGTRLDGMPFPTCILP